MQRPSPGINTDTNNPIVRAIGLQRIVVVLAVILEAIFFSAMSPSFRQYATVWRMQGLPAYLVTLVAQDTHPMRYLRINATLSQFDAFIDFYGIQPGDGMYVAPEDRVAVW